MKALLRWSLMLGLAGSASLGSIVGFNRPAIALPQEEVVRKLQQVPVYTLVNDQGRPLVASVGEQTQQQGNFIPLFISQTTAREKLAEIRAENPQVAERVRVLAVSMGEIYKMDLANDGNADAPEFVYVPVEQQVNTAVALLRAQGQQVDSFPGVPLFVARGADRGYLTIERNDRQAIPMFFEEQQIQQMVERFREQQPDLADSVQIDVVSLQNVLNALTSQDDADLEKVVIVPTRESLQFLQNAAQQSQPQQ